MIILQLGSLGALGLLYQYLALGGRVLVGKGLGIWPLGERLRIYSIRGIGNGLG